MVRILARLLVSAATIRFMALKQPAHAPYDDSNNIPFCDATIAKVRPQDKMNEHFKDDQLVELPEITWIISIGAFR